MRPSELAYHLLDHIERVMCPQWDIESKPGRLPDDEWDVLRKAALRRDRYTCQGCGQRNVKLDVHHIIPIGRGGNNWMDNLISLCRPCHRRIHGWLRGDDE